MIILPAIDIKDGQCVRLYKGDFATVHKVAQNPIETANSFREKGATWLHTVDLDGAKNGTRQNEAIFKELVKISGLKVELGGGIRSMETIEYYLNFGISRVVLGSAALTDPQLVQESVRVYGEKIAVGIDAKGGQVCINGWVKSSTTNYIDLAKQMEALGVKFLIFTDIEKDGMLSGPAFEQLAKLQDSVSCNIIASGGIRDIENIKALAKMNLYGAICGKSIYENTLSLQEALFESNNESIS